MSGPWPAWIGAPALALVTVGACLVGRRPLGVSGVLARFVDLRGELRAARSRAAAAAAGDAAVEAALLAATLEAFGGAPEVAVAPAGRSPASAEPPRGASPADAAGCQAQTCPPPLGAHAAFLLGIVAGGFLARSASGGWSLSFGFGETFERVVAGGPAGWAVLAGGGLLVGAGTAISGGCSTGHGLSGCSRLQPAGVAATVSFFSVAVAVSMLLARGGA